MPAEQTFANHTRYFPPFHFFVMPVMVANLVWHIYWVVKGGVTPAGILGCIFALALILGFLSCRLFALTAQDRVIRLEETLRYMRLLPADLQPRIGEFTLGQMVSLRFASDAELPALARKVLDEKMTTRKPIKQLVKNWKPDNLRA